MNSRKTMIYRSIQLLLVAGIISGCSTNPITGKREVSFYSTASEIQLGEQNYSPSQQSQGGEYYLDQTVDDYIDGVGQKLVSALHTVFPAAADLPYEFVVLDNGVPNAWALPGGKIAINRGLLTELKDESELAAVLGHEIIHAAASHGSTQMSRNTIFGLGAAVVSIAGANTEYGDFISYGSQIGSSAWMAKYGRDDELESDQYGMMLMSEAGYDPQGAVRLQETFVRLSEGQSQDFISGLFASHPPSQQRVNANRARANTLPIGGYTGKTAYQSAIAQITRDAESYEVQDEAAAALNNNNAKKALSLLDQAVKIQPDDSKAWELRGHAWKAQNNNANAETAYTTAINKNDSYYQHWLVRGALRKELGKESAAQSDLERSQSLLPSATASFLMGELAEQRGDTNSALAYFQQAASSSSSSIGVAAKTKLVRYGLSSNPGNYLASGILLTNKGELVAAVQNRSGITVSQVQVKLVNRQTGASRTYRIRGSLENAQQGTVQTGIVADPELYSILVIAATAQ